MPSPRQLLLICLLPLTTVGTAPAGESPDAAAEGSFSLPDLSIDATQTELPLPDVSEVPDATSGAPPVEPGGSASGEPDLFLVDFVDFEMYWNDGLWFEVKQLRRVDLGEEADRVLGTFFSETAQAIGKFGAKVQLDTAAYISTDKVPSVAASAELRRGRLYAQGDVHLFSVPVSYTVEFEIVDTRFFFHETYLRLGDLPWIGDLRFGYMVPPMSLENCESSRDLTLMEAASPVQAFVPGVKFGVEASDSALEGRLTWAAGWFADGQQNDIGDATESLVRIIGRVTGLPWVDDDEEWPSRIHLGASGSYVFSSLENVLYRSRPESHLAPFLVDTGEIEAHDVFVGGLEAAGSWGPLLVQAEILASHVSAKGDVQPTFAGGYAKASWVLTGEVRPYNQRRGAYGRLEPSAPVSILRGSPGAWEVSARYSYLDLNADRFDGGRMQILSAGPSWYLDRNMRILWNYGVADVAGIEDEGNLHCFQMRYQVYF